MIMIKYGNYLSKINTQRIKIMIVHLGSYISVIILHLEGIDYIE